jgi:hypothetical protein
MEYEFQDVFLLPGDFRPQEIILQEEEVEGLLEMDIELGIKLFSREIPQAEGRFFKSGTEAGRVEVSVEEFVPCRCSISSCFCFHSDTSAASDGALSSDPPSHNPS